MTMTPVASSNVASVGYDRENQKLRVQFKNGGLYEYEGVPEKKHLDFLKAESVGAFFHAHIKTDYPCTTVPKEEKGDSL